MKRFKNILFVYSGDAKENSVLQRAIDLAKRNVAKLTAVDVVEELPGAMKLFITVLDPGEMQNLVIKEEKRQLEEFLEPARHAGIDVKTKILIGRRFIEIIREVLREKHDLVMMAAGTAGGLKKNSFSSASLHLLRKCPCPVWVMKPEQTKPHTQILAAVDPAPYDEERQQLNIKILDMAVSLAEIEKSKIHIVHAWDPPREVLLREGRNRFPASKVDLYVAELQKAHKEWLDDLLKKYNLKEPQHQVHLLKGSAGDVIPSLAEEIEAELIVMGTVARTGLPGFFIGNTAESVLNQVNCSVLAVKPDGFISPVGEG